MSKSAHTEAQIIGAVKQVEAGRKADEVAREMGVSKHTIYAWKQKYGGLDVAEAQELKALRDENTRLKKLVADLSLDKDALQHVIQKNVWSAAGLQPKKCDDEGLRKCIRPVLWAKSPGHDEYARASGLITATVLNGPVFLSGYGRAVEPFCHLPLVAKPGGIRKPASA